MKTTALTPLQVFLIGLVLGFALGFCTMYVIGAISNFVGGK